MSEWWLCPLEQCDHGAILHDGDGHDETLVCCVDGCGCRLLITLRMGENGHDHRGSVRGERGQAFFGGWGWFASLIHLPLTRRVLAVGEML